MFIAKNRNGVDGVIFPMEIDTSRVHLEVLPPDEGATIDSVVTKTKQEQESHLRAKYKNYKETKKKQQRPRAVRVIPEDERTHDDLQDLLRDGPQTKEELAALPEWEREKFIRGASVLQAKLKKEIDTKSAKEEQEL